MGVFSKGLLCQPSRICYIFLNRLVNIWDLFFNRTKKYHTRMRDRSANPIAVKSALTGIVFSIEYEYDKRIRTAEKANGSIVYATHPASRSASLGLSFVRVRRIRIPVMTVALT